MSSKMNRPKEQDTSAKPGGDTASYQQLQGSGRSGPAARKIEKMPHERDESASDTGKRVDETPPDAQIEQAHDDIESGQKDTDRRGVPADIPGSHVNVDRKR